MKIISENGKEIWIKLPCGTKTVISAEDKYILGIFTSLVMTGSRSKYVVAIRPIKTEYSTIYERIYLHKLITKSGKGQQIDHIDRNRLNNRRSNLRKANMQQNMANTKPKNNKKYKGVFDQSKYRKLKKPFRSQMAYIHPKGKKRIVIGYFRTAKEAALAYDKKAKEIHGEFAYLNFPEKIKK